MRTPRGTVLGSFGRRIRFADVEDPWRSREPVLRVVTLASGRDAGKNAPGRGNPAYRVYLIWSNPQEKTMVDLKSRSARALAVVDLPAHDYDRQIVANLRDQRAINVLFQQLSRERTSREPLGMVHIPLRSPSFHRGTCLMRKT